MVKNKLYIAKDYGISPSEINKMEYSEYEVILEEINILVKQEEERQKQQEKEQNASLPNYNSIMSNMKSSMPKFTMPKI